MNFLEPWQQVGNFVGISLEIQENCILDRIASTLDILGLLGRSDSKTATDLEMRNIPITESKMKMMGK